MRLSNSLFAVLSITTLGFIQACSSDSDDGGNAGGTGGSSGSPSQGGGGTTSAGTTNKAGAGGVAGAATAGSGAGGAKAGSGGMAGASAGAAGKSGAGSGGMAGASGGSAGNGGATGGTAGTNAGGTSGGASGNAGAAGATGGTGGGAHAMMNFFVTSDTSKTGNLGGLAKADMRCQTLAAAVGAGSKTWRAYLSTESPMVNARDRIGDGPYYNSKGAMLAATKDELHMRKGDADLFIDEKGNKIDGQWNSSMGAANQHDILTGTKSDGSVWTGNTCTNWTSESGDSGVGHSDGMGPGKSTDGNFGLWTGSHKGQCGDTQPGGGAGKIYCFVGP